MPTAKRTADVLPGLDESRSTTAYDVNSAGVVVGSAELASGDWHAVRWVDGRIEDLGMLGGRTSQAQAIDERGRVVGCHRRAGELRLAGLAEPSGRLAVTGPVGTTGADRAGPTRRDRA